MKLVEFCANFCSAAVCCKSDSGVLCVKELYWKNKESEAILAKINKNQIKCYQMADKIKDGFHMELDRRPTVYVKATKWFKAKQASVSDHWIRIGLETSKCRDLKRYEAVLPLDSDLWKDLDTLSKRRLQAWIDLVNETTEHILRLRYKSSLCHYNYKEECRRKNDVLEYVYGNIERSVKRNQSLESEIEDDLFTLERNPLSYIQAKLWWKVQIKLVRKMWKEILLRDLKMDRNYSISVNENGKVWNTLDSLTKRSIELWVENVNEITHELLECRIYRDRTTVRERVYSMFSCTTKAPRRDVNVKLPTSLLWDT